MSQDNLMVYYGFVTNSSRPEKLRCGGCTAPSQGEHAAWRRFAEEGDSTMLVPLGAMVVAQVMPGGPALHVYIGSYNELKFPTRGHKCIGTTVPAHAPGLRSSGK